MDQYAAQQIEKKWQNKWREEKTYSIDTTDFSKPKYYILDMFPYPSGSGLHVGHPKGYIATDVFARQKKHQGYNVLHPMGYDAFGLPAENFALKHKIHPKIATKNNIDTYRKQLEKIGFTYEPEREIDTTDPNYYKWTQWIFLKMFEKGLAYQSFEPIIWCPNCKTGLANEDLENGLCERCGSKVERKPIRQWVLKITDYAERLLNDLETLPLWEASIREMQKNWIGKSEGVEILFKIKNSDSFINVFTTRVDTVFGCGYVVIAPENKLIEELNEKITNRDEVLKYIRLATNKSDLERTDLSKEKTGIKLEGVKAINPFNEKEIDVFVADYVLNSYGTGCVMAVPAHDQRDFEFAEKFNLKIKTVIKNKSEIKDETPYTSDGICFDSGEYSGLDSDKAREKMADWLEKKSLGKRKINYKLKDWVFSRQRYWGEPIPLIHCEKCGVVGVPENELPLKLPEVSHYEPSGTGESPLANIAEWINTKCPSCGGPAKRETNTMPQWAGSSWYYLRYIDPLNHEKLVDPVLEKHWSPVDFYVGGAEHATRHLIYARFWHKFLFDLGMVSFSEPFIRLQHVGLIMGEDGRKMSKRWGNVVNPDIVVENYGADSLRIYEMFMGPFDQSVAWSTKGLKGARRFLDKIWTILHKSLLDDANCDEKDFKRGMRVLHQTIKKVGEDIAEFKFNTAISQMMIFINEISNPNLGKKRLDILKTFLIILSPFAPHIAEELWEKCGGTFSITKEKWPIYDQKFLQSDTLKLAVQVNGKLRGEIEVSSDADQDFILQYAREENNVAKYLSMGEEIKAIYVKNKLVSFVIKQN